ncbi:RNA polymerase sigma-70 factor [Pedobacter yulinensis]|uniref:RNA polymerase sigma-70 factor n=1 Tax=Pedobacter yulinensis TaxID=2126353 RepID=UPI0013A66127|nr:RNA polymerase sigma-70 factor [Pedobacter yulinensis]
MKALTDAELLREWKAGSERAFETLFKRHLSQLLLFARRKLDDKALAEDLVQEAFIGFYWQKANLPADLNVPAYLHTSVRNKIYNAYRTLLARQKHHEQHRYTAPVHDHDTVLQLEARELESRLEQEAERLPAQCRTVFFLSRKEFLTNREIAERLQISVNTVEQHMRRALRQMRQVIELVFLPVSLCIAAYAGCV